MEKHRLSAFNIYFIMLFVVVICKIISNIDIINIAYLMVILCSILKLKLIVIKHKK